MGAAFNREFYRQLFLPILLCCLFTPPRAVLAQTYIGVRITPNINAIPKVSNTSPANISTGTSTAIEAAVDYTFMLSPRWGLSGGADFGGSNWSYHLSAPLGAFGPGQTEVNVSRFHNYLYNSATFNAVYKLPAKNSDIRIFAGPTFRVHHSQRVGASRRGPVNPSDHLESNDPSNSGGQSPYFLVAYPDNSQLLTIISAGIGYERNVTEKLDVLLGLRSNFGLQAMSKSLMTINMNNQLYQGFINTRSSYIGFDVAFRFKTAALSSKKNYK